MHAANRLTFREAEVLRLLAAGHTYVQVGEQLHVSPNTVATHVKNIYRKLGVHSARAALWRALQLHALGEFEYADARADWMTELIAGSPFSGGSGASFAQDRETD